jgi:D-alanine transaminase
MSRTVYVNGAYLPEEDARISVFDRGFLFADGIYEVSAVLGGRLVDCEAHLDRLFRSCREIKLELPWSKAELLEIHREMIRRNELDEGGVYLQVTRGAADRDFAFPREAEPSLVLFTQARSYTSAPGVKTGIKVVTFPDLRWERRDIKSVGLLAQVLAKQHAAEQGANDAWLVEDGVVTEGASSTAWMVKGKTIVSRPLSNKVLAGITRKALLAFLAETDFSFEERPFTLQEALEAEELFLTSATQFVMPVTTLDGHSIHNGAPGPVTMRLRELYLEHAKAGGKLG